MASNRACFRFAGRKDYGLRRARRQHSLWSVLPLVTPASYSSSSKHSSLAAAQRGIKIDIIVETPHRVEGQGQYDTLRALGKSQADRAIVCYWPKDKRECSSGGKPGSLHVKCVTTDGIWLFLSTTNLTENAFTVCGQLAGADYGLDSLPKLWVGSGLRRRETRLVV
jgi:phosphatidylserine/phosphatidylglycerophosphate/cardiolipin synthase-like enzyme